LTSTRNVEPEPRRPSFQAFLPPAHLAQPEAVNGFTSLNGTAKAQSTVALPDLPSTLEVSKELEADGRIDSLSTSPEPLAIVPEPQAPALTLSESQPLVPITPRTPQQLFLSTPLRQTVIRTRFSSPNMREQRRLHKLQTEMEAKLPQRLPQPTQSTDDLDALMSPRAEEFTRNPFHVDFPPLVVDVSPASSTETIKENVDFNTWKEPQQWTPHKSVEDPRSPVQTGGSPIVRNIWDVL
jgi:tyrosine-protein phosphatase